MVRALWMEPMAREMFEGTETVGEAVMLCPSKLNMAEVMSEEVEACVRVFKDSKAEYRNNNNILDLRLRGIREVVLRFGHAPGTLQVGIYGLKRDNYYPDQSASQNLKHLFQDINSN